MKNLRKYKFHWGLLGDLEKGRPNIGNTARVEVYRLMQFTFRDIIEEKYGTDAADGIFYDAGKLAGQQFYSQYLSGIKEFDDFVSRVQELFAELGIGILRIESIDFDIGRIVLTVSEDIDCSGMPENGFEICTYDEGFIAALLESFMGNPFDVKEIDCWSTGDRTCRFLCSAIK